MIEPVALSTDKEDARQRRHTRNIELQWSIYIYTSSLACHGIPWIDSFSTRLPSCSACWLDRQRVVWGQAATTVSNPCIVGFLPTFVKQVEQPMVMKTKQNGDRLFFNLCRTEYSRYSKYTGNRCFRVCELSKSCRLLILLPWHLVDFLNYERYIQKKAKLV